MSKAAELAALIGSQSSLSNRNLIINPSGAVDQRGGSSTINAYSVDRWRSFGGPGGFTISQRTDAGEGDGHAIRFHRTSGDTQTNNMGIGQGLETVNSKRLAGKTLTVSFRARVGADWSPTSIDVRVYHGTGTDENPVSMTGQDSISAVSPSSLTSSFQTFTGTVTIPASKTQITLGFNWSPIGTAGTNDYIDIREVQLEIGEQATPFEHRSYGDELAACQRYYQIGKVAATGRADGGTMGGAATFATAMRASATMAVTSTTGAHYAGSPTLTGSVEGVLITSPVNGTTNNAYRQVTFSADAEL